MHDLQGLMAEHSRQSAAREAVRRLPRLPKLCRWCGQTNCTEVVHDILIDQLDRPSLIPRSRHAHPSCGH